MGVDSRNHPFAPGLAPGRVDMLGAWDKPVMSPYEEARALGLSKVPGTPTSPQIRIK